ncbi:MAG: hypothetical protein Q9225_004518 [Loekoesia sp. 1 TL-2023]
MPESLSLAYCLSCIASFETGYLDLDPGKLQEVFAVSHENSIYVASPLLADPSEPLPLYPVRRIIGNIGKPGLAVLVAPQVPKMRALGYDAWNFITHRPFDGQLEDNFAATSLHLSMTGYQLPLNTGTHGSRDHEAVFVESVISVYDRGDWVADLDVLKAYKSWDKSNQDKNGSCMHPEVEQQDASIFPSLVCIDTWVELLDRPSGYSLVRARGNQSARLAAATIATQKDYQFQIVRPDCCWRCKFESHRKDRESVPPEVPRSKDDPAMPGRFPFPFEQVGNSNVVGSDLSDESDHSSSSLDSDETIPSVNMSPSPTADQLPAFAPPPGYHSQEKSVTYMFIY